jgi:adenine phosphoribosyltransferase
LPGLRRRRIIPIFSWLGKERVMTSGKAGGRGHKKTPFVGNDSIRHYIREINDFPRKGVVFRDITPLLQNGKAFNAAISAIAGAFQESEISQVACIESRGFIIGTALASKLGCGVVPIRKKGKLPYTVRSETYQLEYGFDTLEMHSDAIQPGERVLIADDVLATGGTARAVVNLVNCMQGKIVSAAFLLEIVALNGRSKLEGYPVFSLLQY